VLLATLLVALVSPALRSSISLAFHPAPTPLPTLAADANLVFLESGAPWGAFSLDGLETLPLVPPGSRVSAVWIRLTPGRHTLQVNQPPFATLKCTISLPAVRSDTCPLVSRQAFSGTYFSNGPGDPINGRVIDLGARFDRLPQASAAALVDAMRARLSLPAASVAIAPGDHYLRDGGSVAAASAPLQVALQPDLAPSDESVPSDSARCHSFCDELTDYNRTGETGGLWSLAVAQRASWRVTAADGRVIASHAPLWPSAAPYDTLTPDVGNLRVLFDVRWDGSWQILSQGDFSFGDPAPSLRQVAIEMVSALLKASPGVDTSTMNIFDGRGLNAGQGWALALTLRDPSATTPLYLFYHVGALLAANDDAQRAFPGLPVASAHERMLARAIMGIT
jgi:hypothetical protein